MAKNTNKDIKDAKEKLLLAHKASIAASEELEKKKQLLKLQEKEAKDAQVILDIQEETLKKIEAIRLKQLQLTIIGKELTDEDKKQLDILNQVAKLQQRDVKDANEKLKIYKETQDVVDQLTESETKASDARNEAIDEYKEILKLRREQRDLEAQSLTDITDYNSELTSIGNSLGKQHKLYKAIEARQKSINGTVASVSAQIQSLPESQNKLRDSAEKALQLYKDSEASIAVAAKKLQEKKISQEEYNSVAKSANEDLKEALSYIDQSTDAGRDLYNTLKGAVNEADIFAKTFKDSRTYLEGFNTAMDELGSSGIPLMGDLSKTVKSLANKDFPAAKLAVIALGAAIGKIATDYFAAPWQVEIEFRNERIQNQIEALKQFGTIEVETQLKGGKSPAAVKGMQKGLAGGALPGQKQMMGAISTVGKELGKTTEQVSMRDIYLSKEKAKIDLETQQARIDNAVEVGAVEKQLELDLEKQRQASRESILQAQNEAAFAGARAAAQWASSVAQAAVQFKTAAKTALFGDKLGSVNYGAEKMQLMGIGAEKVAEAMNAASSVMGKMPTAKIGSDMAVLAQRTGQSTESIAQLTEYFERTEGVTAEVALNLEEGMRSLADNAGISLGNLMQEVAEASKDALSYQIKSGPALAKQVAYAQSLGVSFGDIAKAGKNMVLNYKDSIKAEMQLSTLLGKQVDLSEVRAKFASGDTTGALEALKAQGLDPAQMDMFQQEALSSALGGMDLQSLSKIATKQGAQVGDLTAGDAKGKNKDFLDRGVAAQASMNAQNAQISAKQAVVDAKISAAAAESFLKNPELADIRKKQLEDELKQQELDNQKRKDKLEGSLSDEMLARERSIKELDITYDTLQSNFMTFNESIKQAAIELKKLEIEKSFTENLLSTIGGALGGALTNVLTNKLSSLKIPGLSGSPSFADKRKLVQQRQAARNTSPSSPGGSPGGGAPGGGGPGGSQNRPSGGGGGGGKRKAGFKNKMKSKMKGGKAALIGFGLTLLPGIASAFTEAAPDIAETITDEITSDQPETVAPGESPQISGGSSDICACIGALQQTMGVSNEYLRDQMLSSEEYWKEAGPYLKETALNSIKDTGAFEALESGINQTTKAISKGLGKKGVEAAGKTVASEGVEAAGKAVASEGLESVGKNVAKKVITEGVETVGKKAFTQVLKSQGAKLGASMLGQVAKSATSGPLGVVTGVVGGLAQVYGDIKKEEAVQTGNLAALTEGRIADTVGTALEYAGYGAMIGSFIPGIGTAVGGAVGGLIGGAVGIWNNWFSAEAEEMQKEAERAKLNKEALDNLIKINESVDKSVDEQIGVANRTYDIADDEPTWRAAVLVQLVELTKLAYDSLQVALGGTGKGEVEGRLKADKRGRESVDLTKLVQAQRQGKAEALSEREANIANAMQGANFGEYQKKYNVTDKELAIIREKQKLLVEAQKKQSELALQGAQKPAAGGKPTPAPGGAPTPGAAPAPTPQGGAPTPGGAPAAGVPPAAFTAMQTALTTIQTQADARGIIMAGKLDIMNGVLTTIQTQADARGIIIAGKIDTMISILTQVSNKIAAGAASDSSAESYKKLTNINGNAEKQIVRTDKIVNSTMSSAKALTNLDTNSKQLLQVNKNLQALLAVMAGGSSTTAFQLQIDGRAVTNMIQRREEDRRASKPTTGGDGD